VAAGFDVIDINFALHREKSARPLPGGYLLGQVDTGLGNRCRVRRAVPPRIPVTLKMRRGLDDSDESREKFFRIFGRARTSGGPPPSRAWPTVVQRYVGPSRWESARGQATCGQRTVLGSGDLFRRQACLDMLDQTGVDGVTARAERSATPGFFRKPGVARGLPLPERPVCSRSAR